MHTLCYNFNMLVSATIFRDSVFCTFFFGFGGSTFYYLLLLHRKITQSSQLKIIASLCFAIWWPGSDGDWLSCSSAWLSDRSYHFHLLQDIAGYKMASHSFLIFGRELIEARIYLRLAIRSYEISPTWWSWDNSTYYLATIWQLFLSSPEFKNLWTDDTGFFLMLYIWKLLNPSFVTNILLFVSMANLDAKQISMRKAKNQKPSIIYHRLIMFP